MLLTHFGIVTLTYLSRSFFSFGMVHNHAKLCYNYVCACESLFYLAIVPHTCDNSWFSQGPTNTNELFQTYLVRRLFHSLYRVYLSSYSFLLICQRKWTTAVRIHSKTRLSPIVRLFNVHAFWRMPDVSFFFPFHSEYWS